MISTTIKSFTPLILSVLFGMQLLFSCKTDKGKSVTTISYSSEIDSLNTKLQHISQNSLLPGFAVSVVKNEKVAFTKGYGVSDISNNIPFTTRTSNTIASIAKTFIALAIMKLVEEGKIYLDQPINELLPFEIYSPHYPETPITIRHLVTHSSGINDDYDDGEKRASWLVDSLSPSSYANYPQGLKDDIYYYDGPKSSIDDFIASICTPDGHWYNERNFSNFTPGTSYEYSNVGATVAAMIVETVSGLEFSEFTEQYIFEPLGMNHTSWFFHDPNLSYSKMYVDQDDQLYEFPRYLEASYPDGQLKTTANDLTKYLFDMMKGYQGKGILLKPETYQLMFDAQLSRAAFEASEHDPLNDEYNVGVFWSISEPGYRLHKGGMIGVYSIIYFNPSSNVGVLAFCNNANPAFGEVVEALTQFERSIE